MSHIEGAGRFMSTQGRETAGGLAPWAAGEGIEELSMHSLCR